MKKKLFIIAGYGHSAIEPQFDWLEKYASREFDVKRVSITWKYKVMTDYVSEFVDYFHKHKSDSNYVLGFSFGAMVAFISAKQLQPDKLILCSTSSFFSEDLASLKPSWKKDIGLRRNEDFKKYKADEIARDIKSHTEVIYGSKEVVKYPRLKRRGDEIAKILRKEVIVAEGAPHEIDFPSYVKAVKKALG